MLLRRLFPRRPAQRAVPSWRERELAVLHEFSGLRRRLRRVMVMMAFQPIISLLIFYAARRGMSALGQPLIDAHATAALIGMLVFAGTSLLFWLRGNYAAERCFYALNRRASLAAERVGNDEPAVASDATMTLFNAWMDKTLLLRWIRDVRYVFIASSVVVSLGLVSFVALPAAGQALRPEQLILLGYCLTGSALSAVRAVGFSSSLVRTGGRLGDIHPGEKVAERLSGLILEVKDLRRGARLAA